MAILTDVEDIRTGFDIECVSSTQKYKKNHIL